MYLGYIFKLCSLKGRLNINPEVALIKAAGEIWQRIQNNLESENEFISRNWW